MAVEFVAVSDCNYDWVTQQMAKYVAEGWEVQGVQFTSIRMRSHAEDSPAMSVMHVWFKREVKEQAP